VTASAVGAAPGIAILRVAWSSPISAYLVPTVAASAFGAALGIARRIGNRVELMIAHCDERALLIDHGAHEFERAQLSRPVIDQIAHEDGGVPSLSPGTGAMLVTHSSKQRLELVGMAMHVADDVVIHDFFASEGLLSN
jgi:hypothetical protein